MKNFYAFKGYAFQQVARMKRGVARWEKEKTCDNTKRRMYFEKYGYDVKMGYHPLRLLDMVHQILTENDIDLMRNKEECKAMRNGEWGTFGRLEEHVNKRLSELENMALNSDLPQKPQSQPLHNLLQECIEDWYGSEEKMQNQTEYISTADIKEQLNRIETKIDKIN
jgi:hypothetical protein